MTGKGAVHDWKGGPLMVSLSNHPRATVPGAVFTPASLSAAPLPEGEGPGVRVAPSKRRRRGVRAAGGEACARGSGTSCSRP